jgi:hypothetical protein
MLVRYLRKPDHFPGIKEDAADAIESLSARLTAAEANAERLEAQTRRLEDALLLLWHEADHAALRDELPELMDFCAHVHHSIEHEQAMVRRNSWLEP